MFNLRKLLDHHKELFLFSTCSSNEKCLHPMWQAEGITEANPLQKKKTLSPEGPLVVIQSVQMVVVPLLVSNCPYCAITSLLLIVACTAVYALFLV